MGQILGQVVLKMDQTVLTSPLVVRYRHLHLRLTLLVNRPIKAEDATVRNQSALSFIASVSEGGSIVRLTASVTIATIEKNLMI